MNMEQSGQHSYNIYGGFDMAVDDNGGEDDADDVILAPMPSGDFFLDGGGGGGHPVGWDHDPQQQEHHPSDNTTTYANVNANATLPEYELSATSMDDFEPMHFDHEFPDPSQTEFHHESATVFHDFGDDQHADPGNAPPSFMELYNMSIYPDIISEAATSFESHAVPEFSPTNSIQPSTEVAAPSTITATTTGPSTSTSKTTTSPQRQPYKFTPEQKEFLQKRFDAGLRYPSKAEKEELAAQISVPVDVIARWFERTRKLRKWAEFKKPVETKTPEERAGQANYHPQNWPLPHSDQPAASNPQAFQQQFPNTYPYNALGADFLNQGYLQGNAAIQQLMTVNPSAGLYAPIPFVAQAIQPTLQNIAGHSFETGAKPPSLTQSPFAVEVEATRTNREGVYVDDTRNVKKAKIEPKPTRVAPKGIAPKPPPPPKKPITFEEEVASILRPSEWRDDANQAAEDLYDIMGDAEEDNQRKLFLLRSIRTNATEHALKAMSHEDNRKILAKIRNWFTAAIKVEDTELLSLIIEVIRKMGIDGRTMAGIKLGKPLILLMKKELPGLKAQLSQLQKTAYEAYGVTSLGSTLILGLEKDSGSKPLKRESPLTSTAPSTTVPANAPSSASAPPARPAPAAAKMTIPADKAYSNIASKLKPSKGSTTSSFFGKLAQAPAIPKAPVSSKPIPLKKSTIPAQSMGVTAGGAVKSSTAPAPPPKPTTSLPSKSAPASKFSVLEYINRDGNKDKEAKEEGSDPSKATKSKKRKHVSWASDDNLERVKVIENITIKYGDDLFWHPPQEFGNARDLDIGEGRAFGSDTVEYDVEEEIEWYEPKSFSFLELKEDEENRGVKRAGNKVAEAREAEVQKVREAGVLLVSYLNEGDIPDSPSEPFLEELVTSQQAVPPPKVIPLPQELRAQTRPPPMSSNQPLPGVANADVTAILSSLLGSSNPGAYQPPAPVQNPDLASILQSLGGQTPTVPALPPSQPQVQPNIDLTALLSQLQPITPPPPPQQRWTSPPPSSRRDKPQPPPPSAKTSSSRKNQIKASRADDVRESVRNSRADQHHYRLLCQFYEKGGCSVGDACRFVHPRDMRLYDQQTS